MIPALVVAEASYLVGSRLGPRAEARFVRGLGETEVDAPRPGEWSRIADLVDDYADLPLGATDASVMSLAERLGTAVVVTLDRRHFTVVKPDHCPALSLLPA